VERAVLFLARRDEMTVLGAFGAGQGGEQLALLTHGYRLPLTSKCALTDSLDDGQVRSANFDEARFPESFTRLLGKPRSGQCAIFPVLGGQKVIAVVYADNGFSNTAIEQVEMLELAAVQAGLALENELLRRQVGHAKREGGA
jgi:GAF domain-containing protein